MATCKTAFSYFMLTIGAATAAASLKLFLIPNTIFDGGIVGVSIMAGFLSRLPVGFFIFVFNIPFMVLGYKQIGRGFAYRTIFSISALSLMVTALRAASPATSDLLLATVFGGIILGAGVGLIIRHGGSLDGTEIVAILIDRKSGFSVGEIVLAFNVFIFTAVGFVFGWDRAMYSLITYIIAYRVIDITVEGLDESKAVLIISARAEEISKAMLERLGRGVTFLDGRGAFSGQQRTVLYSIISRLEIARLKSIVAEMDPGAFVTITDVREVMGGQAPKKPIH